LVFPERRPYEGKNPDSSTASCCPNTKTKQLNNNDKAPLNLKNDRRASPRAYDVYYNPDFTERELSYFQTGR